MIIENLHYKYCHGTVYLKLIPLLLHCVVTLFLIANCGKISAHINNQSAVFDTELTEKDQRSVI